MGLALLIVAVLSLCVWVYLLLGRGFFWLVERNLAGALGAVAAYEGKSVVAVVPARNEAETVKRCVSSLLAQSVPNLRVIVVDDGSTDATADAARTAAAGNNASDRVTIVSGRPLPPGWTGKLWAVHQGIEHALALCPDFLLLTDADIEHAPDTVASLISIAERGSFDLTSYMVKLHCESVAEKLLIPAFVYFFFQLYPPAWSADCGSRTAGAAGGCMLVRPRALAQIGGIEEIRSEIIDDCALARAIKHSGGRVWLGLTETSHSIRPYGSYTEIGRMISRTAFNQLRHSTLLLAATILGLLVTYVFPVLLLVTSGRVAIADFGRVLAASAFLLMTISYLPMVRFYRLNALWAFTLPFASIFYMGATVWSAIQYWSGRGGQWKGRTQDAVAP